MNLKPNNDNNNSIIPESWTFTGIDEQGYKNYIVPIRENKSKPNRGYDANEWLKELELEFELENENNSNNVNNNGKYSWQEDEDEDEDEDDKYKKYGCLCRYCKYFKCFEEKEKDYGF